MMMLWKIRKRKYLIENCEARYNCIKISTTYTFQKLPIVYTSIYLCIKRKERKELRPIFHIWFFFFKNLFSHFWWSVSVNRFKFSNDIWLCCRIYFHQKYNRQNSTTESNIYWNVRGFIKLNVPKWLNNMWNVIFILQNWKCRNFRTVYLLTQIKNDI